MYQSLKSRYKATMYRDVIHIEDNLEGREPVNVFFFPYGSYVCWGVTKEEGLRYLQEVEDFQDQPLKQTEVDTFPFSYGESMKIIDDELILPDTDLLTKLAVSHGLAQSAKLGAFESTSREAFEKMRQIPEDLAKRGKIRLSRGQIRRTMGELFLERSSINLHVDVLDTPEFFWEHPDLQTLYTYIANELEIGTRGQILNHRLDVMKELFEMLGNEVNHQHSSRLEWTIIWLILIEVMITIFTHLGVV